MDIYAMNVELLETLANKEDWIRTIPNIPTTDMTRVLTSSPDDYDFKHPVKPGNASHAHSVSPLKSLSPDIHKVNFMNERFINWHPEKANKIYKFIEILRYRVLNSDIIY